MAVFYSHMREASGLCLGGLGTGSVELYPDGELHNWQIYNTPRWSTRCFENKVDDGEDYAGALSFYLRCDDGEKVVLRKLSQRAESEEFTYRMFPFVKPIESIRSEIRFPQGTLLYGDEALPVTCKGVFTAPFVPHRSDLSALPVWSVTFTVENPTDRLVNVSLLSKLKTDFANPDGERYAVTHEGGRATLSITPMPSHQPNTGSLALAVSGKGKASYIGGDYTLYLDEYVSHSQYGITQESFLFPFYETGELPSTVAGEALPDDFFDNTALEDAIRRLLQYPFAQSLLSRLTAVYPGYPANDEEKAAFLAVCQRQLRDFTRRKKPFGGSALCESLTLAAGESCDITFTFSWYLPNHIGEGGKMLGHYYETLADNAKDVLALAEREGVFDKAAAFSRLLFKTAVASVYPDAYSLHLSTLVKDSWYLKNGDFGLWEGLGYCGFNTTDILYHASHSLAVLFPDLEKRVMAHTAAFQREDGRMPHFFTPDLDSVDNGFHRVDMNPQYVLMVGRDYLASGDREALASLWQTVVRALASTEALDHNGDGLPDYDTAYNTYDAWHFEGTPSYIAILWLSALKMAIYLADVLGEDERRVHWQTLLDKGLVSLEEKLFNGNCYDLWVTDDGRRDYAVMTDQLDGEIFLRLTLGEGNLSDERFAAVIRYLIKTNYRKGSGLVNATFPKDRAPTVYTFKNCQAEAQWTGIAYLMAAALEMIGDWEIAQELLETVHENQRAFGAFFNHWECGFRYTRPLSSWLVLTALGGIRTRAAEGILALLPHSEWGTHVYPLVTAEALGGVRFDNRCCTVTCREGTLTLKVLQLPKSQAVICEPACDIRYGDTTTLFFDPPLVLTAGDSLTVHTDTQS
ncbi:MAG: hypothetical protein IJW46_08115 [Clostridia bacterium]|nr:hypothetical protein [Clostridia bacterium]